MPGKYLRGALISFTETFPLPVPNLILFQYNPEKLTHGWTPAAVADQKQTGHALAITSEPGETFGFTLYMDATDSIADDGAIGEALGTESGVATRIAALEMLLFPTAPPVEGLIGSISAALSGGGAASPVRPVPQQYLPTVLFVWGPGRILPVRVSALSITETLYHPLRLVPTHAEAQVTLEVLNAAQLEHLNTIGGPLGVLAKGAHGYTQTMRARLARENLDNAVGAAAGMLAM
jgi:hypothetical protein